MSSCETAIWRFDIGVYISCTVFVSFSSGDSEIAASLATRVQPSHSLPQVSQHILYPTTDAVNHEVPLATTNPGASRPLRVSSFIDDLKYPPMLSY